MVTTHSDLSPTVVSLIKFIPACRTSAGEKVKFKVNTNLSSELLQFVMIMWLNFLSIENCIKKCIAPFTLTVYMSTIWIQFTYKVIHRMYTYRAITAKQH